MTMGWKIPMIKKVARPTMIPVKFIVSVVNFFRSAKVLNLAE